MIEYRLLVPLQLQAREPELRLVSKLRWSRKTVACSAENGILIEPTAVSLQGSRISVSCSVCTWLFTATLHSLLGDRPVSYSLGQLAAVTVHSAPATSIWHCRIVTVLQTVLTL